MRLLAPVLLFLVVLPSAMPAQEAPAIVRWGKWGALAAGLGLVGIAAASHEQADDSYGALERRCATLPAACAVGPDGEYLDPVSEGLYQDALDHDDASRRWLVAAEVALVGTAVLFIWDFIRDAPPGNDTIPFEPHVDARHGRLGLQLAF